MNTVRNTTRGIPDTFLILCQYESSLSDRSSHYPVLMYEDRFRLIVIRPPVYSSLETGITGHHSTLPHPLLLFCRSRVQVVFFHFLYLSPRLVLFRCFHPPFSTPGPVTPRDLSETYPLSDLTVSSRKTSGGHLPGEKMGTLCSTVSEVLCVPLSFNLSPSVNRFQ